MIKFIKTDGGRAAAGFSSTADDCVARSIAIITDRPYKEIHDELTEWQGFSADAGGNLCGDYTYKKFIENLGFKWIPTMKIGSGCKVHLRESELPKGRIIARVSAHLVAVIDGVIYDNHDCSRSGKRCVYGYFI